MTSGFPISIGGSVHRLSIHCGAWGASLTSLASVPVPAQTATYTPIPYESLVREVLSQLERKGLRVTRQRYALVQGGERMFGVISYLDGGSARDYSMAIGLRSSYDRSVAVGLVAGTLLCAAPHKRVYGQHGIMWS